MDSLSAFVQSSLFSPLFGLLGVLLLIGFFWLRAGSIHAVLDRLWRIVAGKADVNDPVLKSLLLESRDIEKFQFIYRLKVGTMTDIHKLDAWRKTHDVGVAKLQKIRQWVDITSDEMVRQPPKYCATSHFIFACLAAFSIALISQFDTFHFGYFKMRESKASFKTDAVVVKAPFGEWSFSLKKCEGDKTGLSKLTSLNASDINVICNAHKNDELKDFVEETVKFQRWATSIFMLFLLVFTFVNITTAISAQEAIRLRKKLYPPDVDNNESAMAQQKLNPINIDCRS